MALELVRGMKSSFNVTSLQESGETVVAMRILLCVVSSLLVRCKRSKAFPANKQPVGIPIVLPNPG
jgi:hypothetical protein